MQLRQSLELMRLYLPLPPYLPTGQLRGPDPPLEVVPEGQYLPCAQFKGVEAADPQKNPAGHVRQAVELAA